MKFSKQILILLLCCSLVRVTAQAEYFSPTGQSNDQHVPPPVQQDLGPDTTKLAQAITVYDPDSTWREVE